MSTETNTNDATSVKEVEMNLDDINSFLAVPGAENVMVPEPKDTVFTKKTEDTTFLDNPTNDEESEDGKVKPISAAAANKELDAIVNTDEEEEDEEGNPATKSVGRQKVEKSGLVELTKKLIDEGILIPFDDDKPLDKWTQADFEELVKANFTEKENKVRQEVPAEFFDSLPDELKYAAKYVADGGTDLKGLFSTLAQVEEVRQLDPENERDQEYIVRSYLQATRFGTPEEIQEEIEAWKDRDELANKASKFKPKLDAMQEQVVAQKLVQQEKAVRQQQEQARMYMENVYNVLEPAQLNGIQLDKRTQSMLYAGLTQPNYPSISGKNTNLLGHLLEKYQFVEPNHSLVAEALWLLADPEGYKNKVRDIAVKDKVEKTVRALKTEESRRSTGGNTEEITDNKTQKQTIKRSTTNIFKR